MKTFYQAAPPHIRSPRTLAQIYWMTSLALAPVFVFGLGRYGLHAAALAAAVLLSALAAEALGAFIRRQKPGFEDGSAVASALAFLVLLPPQASFGQAALAMFIALLAARYLWGGLGATLFHPAAIGAALLGLCFPGIFDSASASLGLTSFFGVVIGIGILFWQRLAAWDTPLFFLMPFAVLRLLLSPRGLEPSGFSLLLFAAFFLLPDPETAPLERRSRRIYALSASALTVFLSLFFDGVLAAAFAVLTANACTPWLDRWAKPRPSPEWASEAARHA